MTGDATARLPYLNAVLEETMRIFPPSPVGPPRVSPPGGELVDGTFVPGGTYVSTDVWTIHHDARTVGKFPDKFMPERWCDWPNRPYTVPFSIGPRMCIGVTLAWVEMRIALAKTVLAFDWELAADMDNFEDWIEQARLMQLWKKAPLMIRFRSRG